MSKINSLSLKRNFSWNFFGSLVYSFSQFIILIILAKFGTPHIVGLYSIGLAITAPIVMFTNLQLRQVQATDIRAEYVFNDYYGLRIVMSSIVIVVTIIVSFLNGYDEGKTLIILLVALMKISDSYSDVVYGYLQQRERMDYIGKSRIIKGLSTILIFGFTFIITESLIFTLVIMNVLWFLIFFIYDKGKLKLFLKNLRPKFNIDKFKRLVILTLPLGIVLMLGSLNTNLPRIVIEKVMGEAFLGYFASIAYLLVVGNTFIQAVGQAVAPRLAKLFYNNEIYRFKEIIIKLVVLAVFIGVLGVLVALVLGEFILTIVYDVDYADYNDILIYVMVAGIFTYTSSFLGFGITAMRKFKIQPYIGFVTLLVCFISSIIVIPKYGLIGGSFVLIISALVELILKIIVITYFLKK